MGRSYEVGDWVVYRQKKQSPLPGPRAKNINPSQHGELYSYQVEKYWIVAELGSAQELILRTRRGKSHSIKVNDVCLRKARWWERLFLKARFPSTQAPSTPPTVSPRLE